MTLTSFSLTNFNCSCVRHKLTSFSLTKRSLVQKLAWPAFEKRKTCKFMLYSRANKICQGKLRLYSCVSPAQTTKFSLTSFSLRSLVQKPCQFMSYTRANKTCQRKILVVHVRCFKSRKTFSACTHEQLEPVKENCWKRTCSSYTRARKATKELVKENLVVCAGL